MFAWGSLRDMCRSVVCGNVVYVGVRGGCHGSIGPGGGGVYRVS